MTTDTEKEIKRNPKKFIQSMIDGFSNLFKSEIQKRGLDHFIGRKRPVKTPNGTKLNTNFMLTDIDKLKISHLENGKPNPDYPQELQPRDRERTTSQAWVQRTANNLDPESLGNTSRVDTGAPIVGSDMVVESGNGRAMALRLAYDTDKASEYVEYLKEEANYFGFSSEQVEAIKKPILVRLRDSEIDREKFVIEANQDDKLTFTATERAKADAKRLDNELIALFTPLENGDLLGVDNRPFLDGFLGSIGETESAQYKDKQGDYTQAFVIRVKQAIFAKAYNDDRLLEMMADQSNPEMQNMINALTSASTKFIDARSYSKAYTDDVSTAVTDSMEKSLNQTMINTIIDATNAITQAKRNNQAITEYIKQQGLFSDLPDSTIKIAVFLAENMRSAKRMTIFFSGLAKYIKETALSLNNLGLFGEPEPISIDTAIEYAFNYYNQKVSK